MFVISTGGEAEAEKPALSLRHHFHPLTKASTLNPVPTAAIALGSNLGNREQNLATAIDHLRQHGTVTATSTFFDTAPIGYVDQPRFLNAAVLLDTQLSPQALLQALLAIELQMGRDRSHGIDKGPRHIDLDLLLYGDAVLTTPTLTLPHPAMHERTFVLRPLVQIAPAMQHPLLHRTMQQLLEDLA